MTRTWRYCAHCDYWHLTKGHGVACPDHGDLVQVIGPEVLVVPPGTAACPTCLELAERETPATRGRRSRLAELQEFIVADIDAAILDLADEQQILDMIAEGSPVAAEPP